MTTTVAAVDELSYFVRNVIIRAKHHAQNLNEVTMTLAGAILWKKDLDSEIRVRKNVLWVVIREQRYCFAYVQGGGGQIEMREGSQQGPTIHVFTNKTKPADIALVFDNLKHDPEWEVFLSE